MAKTSIRILGKADLSGRLLRLDEIRKDDKKTRLVEIKPSQIKDHLVMVYFNGFTPVQEGTLSDFFMQAFGITLRESVDKHGRHYLWRPVIQKKAVQPREDDTTEEPEEEYTWEDARADLMDAYEYDGPEDKFDDWRDAHGF